MVWYAFVSHSTESVSCVSVYICECPSSSDRPFFIHGARAAMTSWCSAALKQWTGACGQEFPSVSFLQDMCSLNLVTDWYWYVPKVPLFRQGLSQISIGNFWHALCTFAFFYICIYRTGDWVEIDISCRATAVSRVIISASDVLPAHTLNNKYIREIKTWCAPRVMSLAAVLALRDMGPCLVPNWVNVA